MNYQDELSTIAAKENPAMTEFLKETAASRAGGMIGGDGGVGFWGVAVPSNVRIAIAVTALAGLALAATLVYSHREYTSIHGSSKSSERTVVSYSNLIMGSYHIAHDCKVGNNNILQIVLLWLVMLWLKDRAELHGLNLEGLLCCGLTAEEIKSMRRLAKIYFQM
ncbi:hypothetical protein NE237_029879 [Protea cynaroides]|uniref:Uncharacterized protein n=1 Tax=Protea cynaroides TaxID=273540 RepID=A0A9Q0GS05_9MAGN|nr:hypothetical protein NE237_029879 [Protea cynaroides]